MSQTIQEKIFSLSSIAIAVGVAGFLSAIVTMFINTATYVSAKWIIFLCWLFITAVVVLHKVIYDLRKENDTESEQMQFFAKPFKIINDKGILLIRKNKAFSNNIIVGCYYIDENNIESLYFVAFVSHVQDNFLQIKILRDFRNDADKENYSNRGIDCMIIRPHIPYELWAVLGDTSDE